MHYPSLPISRTAICTKLDLGVDIASVGGGRGETSCSHRVCQMSVNSLDTELTSSETQQVFFFSFVSFP